MADDRPRQVVVIDDSKIQCAVWRRLLEDRYGDRVAVETYSDPDPASSRYETTAAVHAGSLRARSLPGLHIDVQRLFD